MPAPVYFDQLAQAWEEEGLFARDLHGQLIRMVAKTEADYSRIVTVIIDGRPVRIPRAVPTTDSQGNIVHVDASGRTVPRATTILDAARRLSEIQRAELQRRDPQAAAPPSSIPTLCHLDHLPPAGVCRVCSVAVETWETDPAQPDVRRKRRQDKLVPACVQPVEDQMIVHTLESPDAAQRTKVERSVRVLCELLAADQKVVQPTHPGALASEASDLDRLLTRLGPTLGIEPGRFAGRTGPPTPPDLSSPLIVVQHDACILCDRCTRSCSDVKHNDILARQGKGSTTQIAFDLGVPMGESECVSCGECMLACPTTALTFRQPVESDWYREQLKRPGRSAVSPAEMEEHELLRTLPWRYRQWNQSSIVRWHVQPGEELCQLGDYGTTAFLLARGRFGAWLPRRQADGRLDPAWDRGAPTFECGPEELILGEMTILSQYPRTATVRALTAGEVYEIRRNVLYTLQRHPGAREQLNRVYRERAINNHLNQVPLFAQLAPADRQRCQEILGREFLAASASSSSFSSWDEAVSEESPPPRDSLENSARRARPQVSRSAVELLHVEPGQVIFRQGEIADCFYMIHLGHVKVTQTYGGQERVLTYLRPHQSFGEIACLGDWDELWRDVPAAGGTPLSNRRSTSCTALDHVALVRIDVQAFRTLVSEVPALRARIVEQAQAYLAERRPTAVPEAPRSSSARLREFTDQGLYNAQRLLVLDLDACTRCDECTKACSDTHGGITRLIREGLRFDRWLVASSCRSCTDPYCLVGCPVDAIHRRDPHAGNARRGAASEQSPETQRLEIQIENHCIGCGLCASNCPYGNINMHGTANSVDAWGRPVITYRATTCDLCGDIVGNRWREVSCVYACPHDAAFRLRGDELLNLARR